MSNSSRTILVTGASQGLGSHLAHYFAREGWRVWITARNAANLASVAADIQAAGGSCAWHPCDLRDPESIAGLVQKMENGGEQVAALINNAADVTSKPFSDTTPDEIDSLIRANVTGPLQLTRLLLPQLQTTRGAVVNVSSLAGYKANPTQTVYSVSKGAVNAMTEALNAELRRGGVHFVNIALASVGTGPGQVTESEVARRIAQAMDDGAHEVYFSALTKWLMRTYSFFPALKRRSE